MKVNKEDPENHISIPDLRHYDMLTVPEAVALQKQWCEQIDISPMKKTIKYVGGADISFNKFEETVYAGIVILKYPEMVLIDKTAVAAQTKFPYVPGLLAFREVPALLLAWEKLAAKPDVMMLDGHGIAHSRRMGIAAHFGLITHMPSLGCAKRKLVGTYTDPANEKLAQSTLMHKNEQVGVILRTKANCKPVFVSPGYKMDMEQSVNIVKNCTKKYRIPEPTRLAHLWVNEIRVQHKSTSNGNVKDDAVELW